MRGPRFERFAPQYDFDPFRLIAQGYQESRLDQSQVSPQGAIGMQLLQSTADDPAVGIPEIHVPDNNVHAGVKYMRWIRDDEFLWRLYAYWRLEASDDGVFVESLCLSLSRRIPRGIGWMAGPFVRKARRSLEETLQVTRLAVLR